MSATPGALRVLYVHGLESGPECSKVQGLRAQGLRVDAVEMHMSLWRMDKHNSMGRNLLRLWQVWATVVFVLLALPVGVLINPWSGVAMAVGAVIWGRLRYLSWVGLALAKSRVACVEIQRVAVATGEYDVLVGSSWGAAVCAELLVAAHWSGPTVLLAPAVERVQTRIDPSRMPALRARLRLLGPIHILHDPQDEVVPIQDSRELAGGKIKLTETPGAGHRMLPLLESGLLVSTLQDLHEQGQ